MFKMIGHEDQKNFILNKYISKNLHSSIIFYGSKGIGKKNFIIDIITSIIKIKFENKNYNHHINLLNNNTHPNIKIIEKLIDQKTKKLKSNITIDQIRSLNKFVNESSSIKDFDKFIIIDSADDLNINSSNSLLKTLEEPKANTFIFLVSHQLSNLIPTIRSRCMKIKFNRLNFDDFKKILELNIQDIKLDEIKFYYDVTYGSPGNAISLHNDNIIEYLDITINNLSSNKINNNYIELSQHLSKYDNDKFKSYLSILKTILITISKLKINDFDSNNYLSNNFKLLKRLSSTLSRKNIIDKFNYLTNNENDLFTYNLDKKIFMLKFFIN